MAKKDSFIPSMTDEKNDDFEGNHLMDNCFESFLPNRSQH